MGADVRFDFYEKVVIEGDDPALAEIRGELGAVLGRASDEDGRWSYAVSIYRTGICWSCMEDDLQPTGDFDRRETFFDGSTIQVNSRNEKIGDRPANGATGEV